METVHFYFDPISPFVWLATKQVARVEATGVHVSIEPVLFAGEALPVTKARWPGAFDAAQLGAKGLAGRIVRIDWRTKKVAIGEEAAAVRCPA